MSVKPVFATAAFMVFVSAIECAGTVTGTVNLGLVIDPPTTANADGNDGTSTRSGPGTWHLYVFDDSPGSLGISDISIEMENITSVFNRSPNVLFHEDDNDYRAGFGYGRSSNNWNPITGAQPLPGVTSIDPILGFGRAAGDFASMLPPGITVSSQTSPSWGDYATDQLHQFSFFSGSGLFLAEGQYDPAGPAPAISTARVRVYTDANFTRSDATECLNSPLYCNAGENPPEISVRANGQFINNGDMTPWVSDGTDFGYPHHINSTDDQRFEIINSGQQVLYVGNPVITGPFSLVGDFPTYARRNSEEVFRIALDTSTPGEFQGSISFSTSDPNEPSFHFALAAEVILPGDFNKDNTVDAADNVLWRKGIGIPPTEANYNLWRTNFGWTVGGGGSSLVPEPTFLPLLMALLAVASSHRPAARDVRPAIHDAKELVTGAADVPRRK